jgi:serine phosphatase RsbU (regulator of sigma subunit)
MKRLLFAAITIVLFIAGTLNAQGINWNTPRAFSSANGSFPVSAYNGGIAVVAWQETASAGTGLEITVHAAVKQGRGAWITRENIAKYSYSGAEPSMLSAAVDSKGRIVIAAAASGSTTDILLSSDLGVNFTKYTLQTENSVAPRVFARTDGGYLLFVSRGRSRESFSLYYSRSDNGAVWSNFQPFISEQSRNIIALPSHASFNGREYIIYQSQISGADLTFQLYLRSSGDNGRNWNNPVLITNFRDSSIQDSHPEQFDNQRAHLSVQQGKLFAVWERRYQNRSPQIYGTFLNNDGSLLGFPEQINFNEAYCNNPVAFQLRDTTAVVWFDNSQGGGANRIMFSSQSSIGWDRGIDISKGVGGDASFARPVVSADGLSVFWQTSRQNQNRIYALAPDNSVTQPAIIARNFVSGRKTRNSTAIVSWTAPVQGSIRGYSWLWSKNPDDEPQRELMSHTILPSLEQAIEEDGTWYFSLIAQDYAGSWSIPVQVSYIRSTAGPQAVSIIAPETDEQGFLLSNTFTLNWKPPQGSDIAGFTWNLQLLGSSSLIQGAGDELNKAASERFESLAPPPRIVLGSGNSASFTNRDNGLWAFVVAAVDEAGNIGPPARIFLKTNKYAAQTIVSFVDTSRNDNGLLMLRIYGRGFTDGGAVTRVMLDKDGQAPYDLEFSLNRGQYQVLSDSEISGLNAGDPAQGIYRIVIEHPARGIFVSSPLISVDKTGTIKFGDFSKSWQASWKLREGRTFVVDTPMLVIGVVLLFCVLGLLAPIKGIANTIKESAAVQLEIAALITGDIMPSEKKRRLTRLKRKGGGLRIKMASFTIGLVVLLVVMISSPLYIIMRNNQEATLFNGLYDKVSVLLNGIATSAKPYMPGKNYLELGFLPSQSRGISEAVYVTITGYGADDTAFFDYVLATNDPDIESKIDTAELIPGQSRLSDPLSPQIENIAREINEKAWQELSESSKIIASTRQETLALMEITNPTPEQTRRFNEIADTSQRMQNKVLEYLDTLSEDIGSVPEFSTTSAKNNTSKSYLFYKPILYGQGADTIYYRGMVRLEVTIDSILTQIGQAQRFTLIVIVGIALLAIVIGAVGAFVLASLIIRPITRLVSHVERIRDTEDKTKLDGVNIEIQTKDEIAVLGNTINDMTHGLVKAALAASDLSMGKEIQKKFIPLELDRDGNKLTSGFKDTKNVQFFGYYEGAKGVSGDYFDYQDLDGRYFAIIKCDVAGKGIPAALIMIQVATMFLGFFRRWKPTEKGMHIEDLVYQINDFIENMGFKGRFAAFTLCLFDSQTGIARFCNAGDNLVHWYDASEGKLKTVTLKETPATGVLPNFLVESKGGYTVQTVTLDHDDILFLYTDGIEESKRRFRNAAFEEIICEEGEIDTPHANHTVGQAAEEMTPERVHDIVNAVMNAQMYSLHKYHNPEGEENDLTFDFTSCKGKVEEAIMAMVGVEKIFRMYKNPNAGEETHVLVDKKVDEFLRQHFRQYRDYCYDTKENPGNDAYLYYTKVNEDEQYDDLTILGLKRK